MFGVIHIDMRGEEALAKLQESASSGNHHLVDIVGCVRQYWTNIGLEVEDIFEERGRRDI